MANYNLNTDRQQLYNDIWPLMIQLNQKMADEKAMWQKFPTDSRKKIIEQDMDVLYTMLFTFYKKLRNNWFGPKWYSQRDI